MAAGPIFFERSARRLLSLGRELETKQLDWWRRTVAGGNELSRRDFARLTLAAFAGFSAGASAEADYDRAKRNENPLLSDPHVCRGLNTCRGKGSDRRNKC